MNIGRHVKDARLASGLTQAELAQKAGVTQQSLSKLESGKSQSSKHILQIAKALNVDPRSLMENQPPAAVLAGSKLVRDWDLEEELDDSSEVAIPVVDIVLSAGAGRIMFEFLETLQKLAFSRSFLRRRNARPEDCVVMKVEGDSMWPTVSDGDHVLINRADTRIVDGKVYALAVGGEAKIKRLKTLYHGGLQVVSDNKHHQDEEIPPDGMEHVQIIGRALQRSGEL